ncbi:MAG TPA: DUF3106 domain-containing protein [Steroidobacteraceae bacterium]|nr:DUF3106 domain-containing protein [Steroidobacteraceae bacterium]
MCTKPGLLGALVLTGLLSAGVCLPVSAQGVNPPMAAPAAGGVPWSSLSPDQQRLLSRLSGQWDQLPAQRQQSLASGSQRWLGMSPEQRTQARQRFRQWQQLPPQRRDQLRKRWEEFRSLPPARQQADRDNYRRFQQLPQQRRQQLRQRWKNATPAQRQDMVDRARARRGQRSPKLR